MKPTIPTEAELAVLVQEVDDQLNVVAKLGIEAVCEGCAEDEAARDKARKKAADEKFDQQ